MSLHEPEGKARHSALFFMAGVAMIGVAIFCPNSQPRRPDAILHLASSGDAHHMLNWTAIINSGRLILMSLGAYLILDALNQWVMEFNYRTLSSLIQALLFLPIIGLLLGLCWLLVAIF